jgi:hypothetical protein
MGAFNLMAGDWIKMRVDLHTHPKIVRILSAVCPQPSGQMSDRLRVVGGLHAVWSLFDAHSVDGRLEGYTVETLDHVIGWPGFGDAMISVNWLAEEETKALVLPEFSEHNGQSAKRRAEDQKRKRNVRKASEKRPHSVRTVADKCPNGSGLEKRREEEEQKMPSSPADFRAELFRQWKGLPNGGGGAFLGKLFKEHKPEQRVLEAIEHTLDDTRADPKAFVLGVLNKQAKSESELDDILRGAI